MSESTHITKLIELENILNQYCDTRYHFRAGDDWLFSIVEVKQFGKEKMICKDLTLNELYKFLGKHLRITLQNKERVTE